MAISKIHHTSLFIRDFKKLSSSKQQVAIKREKEFRKNPFSPHLRTHKLSGKLTKFWAFSITYQERVLFRLIKKNEVIFYKIGSHAIYK